MYSYASGLNIIFLAALLQNALEHSFFVLFFLTMSTEMVVLFYPKTQYSWQ